MEKELTIKSHRGDYKVFFRNDLDFLEDLKKRSAIWVIDRNVFNLYSEHFRGIDPDLLILFDATESAKTLDRATRLHRDLIAKSCKRSTNFISVGGGITQDVTGFVASTLYRGLNWVYLPTTLLAQADSCIGSKTSLNFDSYKNLLGTFYPPKEIFISAEFLKTLPLKEIFSGMGEIIKFQLMKVGRGHTDLIAIQERLRKIQAGSWSDVLELIQESLAIKKSYIEEDEFDYSQRRFLNYGHCFGHAFEAVSNFAIPHGLAVVAGIIFAYIISAKRKWINDELFDLAARKLLAPCFHGELLNAQDSFFDPGALFEAMKKDKKRTGDGIPIILPKWSASIVPIFQLYQAQDLSFEEMVSGVEEFKKIIA